MVRRPASAALMVLALLAPAVAVQSAGLLAPAAATTGHTFYVDPRSGADANPGTRREPWRTLARVSNQQLGPGDRVLLRRGTRQVGELTVGERDDGLPGRPILVSSYGRGALPVISEGSCVTVYGDYVTLSRLKAADCGGTGFRYGIDLQGDHDVVTRVDVTRNLVGIAIDHRAADARVTRSHIYGNNQMVTGPGCYDDYGAQGISVSGDRAVIEGNRIDDQGAASSDFGMDGSAVEIVGGVGTRVVHNLARNDIVFSELGPDYAAGRAAQDTMLADNRVTSTRASVPMTECGSSSPSQIRTYFVLVFGSSSAFGGSLATHVVRNAVHFTGAGAVGILCDQHCTPQTLDVESNILGAPNPGWVDTGVHGFRHRDNILGTATPSATVETWGPPHNEYGERYVAP